MRDGLEEVEAVGDNVSEEEEELRATLSIRLTRQVGSPHVLALLKVDGSIYDQIYADLMILMKSNKLSKKYLDMNIHYLELVRHLELLGTRPRLLLDPSIQVFQSEPQLYRENKKMNHRIRHNSLQIRSRLHSHDEFDESCTFPLIKKASERMLDKIKTCDEKLHYALVLETKQRFQR